MIVKRVPNAISCLRLALAVMLLTLTHTSAAFAVVYLLCGITDVADGYLARRWAVTSPLGAKLDSLADLAFWAVILFIFWRSFASEISFIMVLLFCLVAAVRLLNFLITKVKFRQHGMVHTLGNKAAGLALFLAIPGCIILKQIPWLLAGPVFLTAMLSALEETVILLTCTSYDPDKKSGTF